ncbi:MAG TPA: hypothetical protein VEQ58_03450, partial [Polyangiaceae bacterium]|nr:hypothetical protein [Polyangiaceae bacterium]
MKLANIVPFAALLLCQCGGQSEQQLPPETRVEDPLLAQVSSLSRGDQALSDALRGRYAFVASQRGYETSPSAAADAAFVRLDADGDFELALSRRNRALAKLHASDMNRTLRDGLLVSEPSIWLQSGDKLEQLLLSQSGEGVELQWQLELEPPIVGARLERSGALLLVDKSDRGLLRVPVPYGVDAAGQRIEGALGFVAHHERKIMIDISFSVPGTSHPPLLVDPALAVVLWQERTGDQPEPRVKTAMAYSPELHANVLYGGSDDVPGSPPLDDTWTYDGKWTQLEP